MQSGYTPISAATQDLLMKDYVERVQGEYRRALGFVPIARPLTPTQAEQIENITGGFVPSSGEGLTEEILGRIDEITGGRHLQFLTKSQRSSLLSAHQSALSSPVDYRPFVRSYLEGQINRAAQVAMEKIVGTGEFKAYTDEAREMISRRIGELTDIKEQFLARRSEGIFLDETDASLLQQLNRGVRELYPKAGSIAFEDLQALYGLSRRKNPDVNPITGQRGAPIQPTLRDVQNVIVGSFMRPIIEFGEKYDQAFNGPDVMQNAAQAVLEFLPYFDRSRSDRPLSYILKRMRQFVTGGNESDRVFRKALREDIGHLMTGNVEVGEGEEITDSNAFLPTNTDTAKWYDEALLEVRRAPSEGVPVPFYSRTGRLFSDTGVMKTESLMGEVTKWGEPAYSQAMKYPWMGHYEYLLRKSKNRRLSASERRFLDEHRFLYKQVKERKIDPYEHPRVIAPKGMKQLRLFPEDVSNMARILEAGKDHPAYQYVSKVVGFISKNYVTPRFKVDSEVLEQDAAAVTFDAVTGEMARNPGEFDDDLFGHQTEGLFEGAEGRQWGPTRYLSHKPQQRAEGDSEVPGAMLSSENLEYARDILEEERGRELSYRQSMEFSDVDKYLSEAMGQMEQYGYPTLKSLSGKETFHSTMLGIEEIRKPKVNWRAKRQAEQEAMHRADLENVRAREEEIALQERQKGNWRYTRAVEQAKEQEAIRDYERYLEAQRAQHRARLEEERKKFWAGTGLKWEAGNIVEDPDVGIAPKRDISNRGGISIPEPKLKWGLGVSIGGALAPDLGYTSSAIRAGATPMWDRSSREPASGGGSGGDEPPDFPPFDMIEPPMDEGDRPDQPGTTYGLLPHPPKRELKEGVLPILERGGRAILNAPTGWGKTSALIAGAVAQGTGFSIISSPLSTLNKQITEKLNQANVEAIYMPGYPGEGAPQAEWDEYNAANDQFYNALGITWEGGEMFISGEGRIKKADDGFIWEGGPLSIVTSFEKLAASDKSRMGRAIRFLADNDLLKFVGIDEAHELFSASRHLGRYLPEIADRLGSGYSMLLSSGSLTSREIATLQGNYGIPDENVIKVPHQRNPRIHWRAMRNEPGSLINALRGTQPAFIFPSHVGKIKSTVEKLRELGNQVFPFHKAQTDPLSQEEIEFAERKLTKTPEHGGGLVEGEIAVMSGAAATGVDRPEVGQVVVEDPYSMNDLMQKAGRLRGPAEGAPDKDFSLIFSSKTYESRLRKMIPTMERLQDPNFLGGIYETLRAGTYNRNWKVASSEMQETVGDILEREGLHRYSASTVLSYFNEAGLISLGPTQDDEGEEFFGYAFTEGGGLASVADRIARAKIKSRYQLDETGGLAQVSVAERVREDVGRMMREQKAMASIFEQAIRSSKTPEEAGELIYGAVDAWNAKEGGDLEGLENYARTTVPRELAQRYIRAIESAAKAHEDEVKQTGNLTAAAKNYQQAVNQAYQYIAQNQTAMQYAAQAGQLHLIAGMQTGNAAATMVGQTALQHGTGAVVPPNFPPPGGGGGGPVGGGQFQGGNRNVFRGGIGSVLYSTYIASRFWRMLAGDVPQDMAYYQRIMSETAPVGQEPGSISLSGAAARPAQDSLNRLRIGRAAQEIFGPVSGVMDRIVSNPGAARALETLKVAGGVGAAGYILSNSQLAAMFGLPFLPWAAQAGLVAAGGVAIYGMYRSVKVKRDEVMADYEALGIEPEEIASVPTSEAPYPEGPEYDYWRKIREQDAMIAPVSGDIGTQGGGVKYPELTPEQKERARQIRGDRPDDILDALVDASGKTITTEEGTPLYQRIRALRGGKMLIGDPGFRLMTKIARAASAEGMSPDAFLQLAESYASTFAHPGTPEYESYMDTFSGLGVTERSREESRVSFQSQFAGQLNSFMSQREAFKLTSRLGIDTRAEAGALYGIYDLYQTFGGDLDQIIGMAGTPMPGVAGGGYTFTRMRDRLAEINQRLKPIASSASRSFVQPLLSAGMPVRLMDVAMQAFENLVQGFTPSQVNLTSSILGGDLMARSYAAWNDPQILQRLGLSVEGSRFFDRSGNPIYETSGQGLVSLLAANGVQGSVFEGITNQGLASAFLQGGTRQAQAFLRDQLWGIQNQQFAMQRADLERQRQFLWGGGPWTGTPLPGSMWFLEDQQRAMSFAQTMRGFQYQQARMDLSNQFGIRQEGISWERMQAGFGYQDQTAALQWERLQFGWMMGNEQAALRREAMERGITEQRWSLGFEREGMLLQRGWEREDWQYQDQMRSLSFAWGIEDINEAIRFASGRQRRQLIRQRERMVLTENLEGQQIERGRDRQEQLWAREDERFKRQSEGIEKNIELERKQFELSETQRQKLYEFDVRSFQMQEDYRRRLQELDVQQFELNREQRETFYEMERRELAKRIEEYQEMFALQEKIVELSRNHQAESLVNSEKSLALAEQEALLRREMDILMQNVTQKWGDLKQSMELTAGYGDNISVVMQALQQAMSSMQNVDARVLTDLRAFVESLRMVDPTVLSLLVQSMTGP